ncbi:hypothetical protein FB45DRAFT_1103738 [Roridomyces roridus]|uniref:Uncharacterized protein n=1 Tax=Roridomyces roridus TaxID=1738132 RepID=A0AAD7AX47_9AGAR|nr:hypothetical protein FB45DRAFT_1103738 [Roridomyces roridus]
MRPAKVQAKGDTHPSILGKCRSNRLAVDRDTTSALAGHSIPLGSGYDADTTIPSTPTSPRAAALATSTPHHSVRHRHLGNHVNVHAASSASTYTPPSFAEYILLFSALPTPTPQPTTRSYCFMPPRPVWRGPRPADSSSYTLSAFYRSPPPDAPRGMYARTWGESRLWRRPTSGVDIRTEGTVTHPLARPPQASAALGY